jgi:hypothetical protein
VRLGPIAAQIPQLLQPHVFRTRAAQAVCLCRDWLRVGCDLARVEWSRAWQSAELIWRVAAGWNGARQFLGEGCKVRTIALAVLALVAMAANGPARAADYPSYLILRTPKSSSPAKATHGYYPGQAQEVHTQSYSYGWFGASPRHHWSRHFGTSRNYTQWTRR